MDDLHALPKIRDSLSYVYAEHARIDKHEKSIAIHDARGLTPLPVAALCVLMLGPGTTVSHAAVQVLADNNCLVVWCGEQGVRFYACGTGGTRSAAPLLHQARLASDERARLEVVRRMYAFRFGGVPDKGDTVESLRGKEGFRMRETYARLSKETGVPWDGRSYDRQEWTASDLPNRALSCANSCLYGLCHAAILACGYSPGLGFIHTGKQLSFVYDIADLYKTEITIPVAFTIARDAPPNLERAVRLACRDRFRDSKLLQRLVPDMQKLLDVRRGTPEENEAGEFAPDDDPALPTELWTPSPEVEAEAARRPDAPTDAFLVNPEIIETAATRNEEPLAAAGVVGVFVPDPGCETPLRRPVAWPWETDGNETSDKAEGG